MPISDIGQVFPPLFSPLPGPTGAQLVEEGPQVLNARLPETVVTDGEGRPRMGLSRRPADFAFSEFLVTTIRQHVAGTPAGAAGRSIDLLA